MKGKHITLSASTLSAIINIKNEGNPIEDKKSWPISFDLTLALKLLLKTDQVNLLMKLTINIIGLKMNFL